jgi:hypothetical protein
MLLSNILYAGGTAQVAAWEALGSEVNPTASRKKHMRIHENEHISCQNSSNSENTVLGTYVKEETNIIEEKEDLK